jgi:methylenetetrahydrofolate reductase (NADPH)
MSAPQVSFEFFPPRTAEMEVALWRAVRRLERLAPRFVSVSYGAGGSTRERTHDTVVRLRAETGLEPAAHLTCVAASRAEVDAVARRYAAAGVRRIVALRGDPPAGTVALAGRFVPHPDGYRSAAELVAGLKRIADFEISVAVHPEGHPDAVTLVPGVLPVTNLGTLLRFAAGCGATVPGWLRQRFAGLEPEPEVRALVAASVATELCSALLREGVGALHFYTLNRAELTTAICRALGVVEARVAA